MLQTTNKFEVNEHRWMSRLFITLQVTIPLHIDFTVFGLVFSNTIQARPWRLFENRPILVTCILHL